MRKLPKAVFLIAVLYVAVHLALSNRYGIFRDAMYLLDCGRHLAWGYVDQPPLFPFLAFLIDHTLGASLPVLIIWPALAGALRITLTAKLANDLGAGRFGTVFAAVVSSIVSGWLLIDHQFSMNAFEPLFLLGCALAIVRLIKTRDPKTWLVFGAIAGLGLENKYSFAGYAAALVAGLAISRERRVLVTPWLLAGGAIAFVIALPNLIWMAANDWPFLQFLHNVSATGKDVIVSPARWLLQQILIANPFLLPFWLGGLLYLLFGRNTKSYRALGFAFLLILLLFELSHGKDYYSLPAYPIVFAAAGLASERLFAARVFTTNRWLRPTAYAAIAIWLAVPLAIFLPMLLPVLPIDGYLAYQEKLGFTPPRSEKNHASSPLPQYYADELGWEEMVATVARVYHKLPPADQAKAAILTSNYGQAGAIDYFGPKYNLPPAISYHNTFWIWGTRGYTGEIVIRVGGKIENERKNFTSVEQAAELSNPYVLAYERRPILLCRGLHGTLGKYWPDLKTFD